MFHNYCYRGVLNVTPNGKAGDVPRCVWMAGGHTAWCAATAYVSAVPVVTYAGTISRRISHPLIKGVGRSQYESSCLSLRSQQRQLIDSSLTEQNCFHRPF